MNAVMRRLATGVLALCAAGAGSACTSAPTGGSAADRSDVGQACFNVDRVRSYSALHERYVYVRVGRDEHYLLTLDATYIGLPFATGIGISGSFRRVCSDSGAMLTFADSVRQARARIVRVEAVADRDAARELVARRTAPARQN